MKTRTSTVATLTLTGLCAAFAPPARAQQSSDQPAPPTYQTGTPQSYPGQPPQPPAYPQQPDSPQPNSPQPYPPPPYPGHPYPPPPDPPQPYNPPAAQGYSPAPQGTLRYVNRRQTGLIVGGAVTLGGAWLVSVGIATLAASQTTGYSTSLDFSETWPLLLPIVGPWIQMKFTGSGPYTDITNTFLVLDGVVQAGGLAMLIAGVATHQRVAIYAKNGIQLTPLLLSGSSGMLVSGRF